MIHQGDCVEVMAAMDAESIDAIVTDPPYSLAFMGKAWDKNLNHGPWAEAAIRVAKPGAYLLAFGGTRTVHRMTVALEDAGWITRDLLVWGYASGFPKSKASLKPAWEPIVLARKPGPLAKLRIDECRLPTSDDNARPPRTPSGSVGQWAAYRDAGSDGSPAGRWPANIVLTDPIFDGGWDGVEGGGVVTSGRGSTRGRSGHIYGNGNGYTEATLDPIGYGDTGTYSRFFIIPKASRKDREPDGSNGTRRNTHPTVKPTALMRHLIRLVTPEGGTVLDPFLGSGTTAKAAVLEGVKWVGIERELEYIRIAEQRLVGLEPEQKQDGLGL